MSSKKNENKIKCKLDLDPLLPMFRETCVQEKWSDCHVVYGDFCRPIRRPGRRTRKAPQRHLSSFSKDSVSLGCTSTPALTKFGPCSLVLSLENRKPFYGN
ncbi:hypothetical protein J6590_083538 [Homalodisca vitripennis]|nr:hypothetical protein J6590_083538 [Homalodisca vitripennis]